MWAGMIDKKRLHAMIKKEVAFLKGSSWYSKVVISGAVPGFIGNERC